MSFPAKRNNRARFSKRNEIPVSSSTAVSSSPSVNEDLNRNSPPRIPAIPIPSEKAKLPVDQTPLAQSSRIHPRLVPDDSENALCVNQAKFHLEFNPQCPSNRTWGTLLSRGEVLAQRDFKMNFDLRELIIESINVRLVYIANTTLQIGFTLSSLQVIQDHSIGNPELATFLTTNWLNIVSPIAESMKEEFTVAIHEKTSSITVNL